MSSGDIRFTKHAAERLLSRGIGADEALQILAVGEIIQKDRQDSPSPALTRLGWVTRGGVQRPVHVVSATDTTGEIVIITVYWPDPNLWDADFRRRLK